MTDKERSQNSYTTSCNGVISQGAPIEGIQVFAKHTRTNKPKTKCVHNTHLMNDIYFDLKNLNTPRGAPYQDKDGAGSEISSPYPISVIS